MRTNENFIVRTKEAGVFFGEVKEYDSNYIVMRNVRKIFSWEGAAAVEQLSTDGSSLPDRCRLTISVGEMWIANPIQVLPCTDKASENLKSIKEWKR